MEENLKFGIEIELNALEQKSFLSIPMGGNNLPEGISYVASLISGLGLKVEIKEWSHNHDNKVWICKPDASCGIEVCSPVLDASHMGILNKVMDLLGSDNDIKTDERCSIHVHVDIPGAYHESPSVAAVLAWWIKCEHVFMDIFPPHRKINRYCRCVGETSLFNDSEIVVPCSLIKKMSDKYLSANSFHLFNRKRKSVEFRLMEGTRDSSDLENWIHVLFHFVNRSLSKGIPEDYRWVEIHEFFEFMDFENSGKSHLVNWIFSRIFSNCNHALSGPFSKEAREHAFQEYNFVFRQTHSFIESVKDK